MEHDHRWLFRPRGHIDSHVIHRLKSYRITNDNDVDHAMVHWCIELCLVLPATEILRVVQEIRLALSLSLLPRHVCYYVGSSRRPDTQKVPCRIVVQLAFPLRIHLSWENSLDQATCVPPTTNWTNLRHWELLSAHRPLRAATKLLFTSMSSTGAVSCHVDGPRELHLSNCYCCCHALRILPLS